MKKEEKITFLTEAKSANKSNLSKISDLPEYFIKSMSAFEHIYPHLIKITTDNTAFAKYNSIKKRMREIAQDQDEDKDDSNWENQKQLAKDIIELCAGKEASNLMYEKMYMYINLIAGSANLTLELEDGWYKERYGFRFEFEEWLFAMLFSMELALTVYEDDEKMLLIPSFIPDKGHAIRLEWVEDGDLSVKFFYHGFSISVNDFIKDKNHTYSDEFHKGFPLSIEGIRDAMKMVISTLKDKLLVKLTGKGSIDYDEE